MTISLLVGILVALFLGANLFMSYNRSRSLFLAMIPAALFVFAIWMADKFFLSYGIVKTVGTALTLSLPSFAALFDVTTAGLYTDGGVMLVFLLALLIFLVSLIVVYRIVLGIAPWKTSLTRTLWRFPMVLLSTIGFSFVVVFTLAGLRNAIYLRPGLLNPLFEALFPFEECFV